jgi:hypothetical protein
MTPFQELFGFAIVFGLLAYGLKVWVEEGWKAGLMVLSPFILYGVCHLLLLVS